MSMFNNIIPVSIALLQLTQTATIDCQRFTYFQNQIIPVISHTKCLNQMTIKSMTF